MSEPDTNTTSASSRVNGNVVGAVALYNPNGVVAIIAFLAFLSAAAGLFVRHYGTKPRAKYMRPLVWGTLFMALGYLCRFTRRNHINAWSWLFETLFILLSPCAFLATEYMLVPHLAQRLESTDCLLIPPQAMVWIFVLADIVTVAAQLAGTALTITFGKLVNIGVKLATAGLWIQAAFFAVFLSTYTTFGIRFHRKRHHRTWQGATRPSTWNEWRCHWKTMYYSVGMACTCLLIRSVYRVAEYTSGAGSALGQSEIAFYLLDTIPLLILVSLRATVWAPICLDNATPSNMNIHISLSDIYQHEHETRVGANRTYMKP